MENIETLISGLPDEDAARRFFDRLAEQSPSHSTRLHKNSALLSDVAAIVAFSPLLASTILHDPEYIWWLDRKRRDSGVVPIEELIESLSRFSLTNSTVEPHTLFSRFRRRELLRIYLRDIRRLATIAEITEELSNLADAIIEYALQLGIREMNNRFGTPQQLDQKGRSGPASFCVMALGKLGSRELNYSSDVDLVFLYSGEGSTTGQGSRGAITNREYFIKLGEYITKLIGEKSGEGAAYRVDLRLRPHGRLGALALSVSDAIRYYTDEAQPWERQVLIRSRACAGDASLIRMFLSEVEKVVFSATETVESALQSVASSKQEIDLQQLDRGIFDVKLGRGGIREIEFIAQALQLAYGGKDRWLRSPHTLISLARLTERGLLSKSEYSELSSAYELLRRTEHILQMENGLQTHTVPDEPKKRLLLAARTSFVSGEDFESSLERATSDVHRIFERVFDLNDKNTASEEAEQTTSGDSGERSAMSAGNVSKKAGSRYDIISQLVATSPRFAPLIQQNSDRVLSIADSNKEATFPDYSAELSAACKNASDFGGSLTALRESWSKNLLDIVICDLLELVEVRKIKDLLTELAEASVTTSMDLVRREIGARYKLDPELLKMSILALGKLGGRGMDYDSDLDLIFIYDRSPRLNPSTMTVAEAFSRLMEQFVNALSAMTRGGNLYRVDLRLRPYGTKGLAAMPADAFLDYLRKTAEIWELLAFLKVRDVGCTNSAGISVEEETRRIIHKRAAALPVDVLRDETIRVRKALENRARIRRTGDVDIKYGEGGMLDIYFAVRYLQLRDDIPDEPLDRSTFSLLNRLRHSGSLSDSTFQPLVEGYKFLSDLDHSIRLTIGRNSMIRFSNRESLDLAIRRMSLRSQQELEGQLAVHRIAIRNAFEEILS